MEQHLHQGKEWRQAHFSADAFCFFAAGCALPRRNEWVFSRPGNLPALSLHGLRRNFGTLAQWAECPTGVSAQIMGHAPSAIAEMHYRRRQHDLLRQWHVKIEAWIPEQTGIDFVPEKAGLRVVLSSAS